MPSVRGSVRVLAVCLLLLPAWAAGGAAAPEDREVPPNRGQLRLKPDACQRLLAELRDAGRPLSQRTEIVGLFAYFKEERAVPDLVAIVRSERESMALKTAVLWALGEIGHSLAMPAFQYALNQIYVKKPEWVNARGMTVALEGQEEKELSLRELCESRLGRLAERVLVKGSASEHTGFVDTLLAPLVKGVTPDKPPEEDEGTGRMRAALISVAAVGDRSPTSLNALTTVLTADDNYYPWDFKVIASEALATILVRRTEEFKRMAAELKGARVRDKLADEIATAFIQAFAITDSPEVRETGGLALRKAGWADRAAKSLVTVLKTPNLPKRVRYRAIEALAYLESKEAADQLIFLLFDPDANIRWRAAVSLGSCGDKRAAGFLRKLTHDEDHFVRVKAVSALGRLGEFAVLPDVAVAMGDPDYRVRHAAARALGALGFRQGIPALVNKGLKDPSPTVRAVSIVALGRIGRDRDKEGLKEVAAMVADKEPAVRLVAVSVLAKFTNPDASKALVAALGDADTTVRAEATKAMADRIQRNPKVALELLSDAIAGSKGAERLAAIQCVDADYRKAIGTREKDPKRAALYERLLGTPRDRLAAALVASLKDDDAKVRAAAGRLLLDHAAPPRRLKELLAPVAELATDLDRDARTVGVLARNHLNSIR